MKCLVCLKGNARRVEPYGWLPCESCTKRQREISKPKTTVEVTTDQIREDRKVFKKDLYQPFRQGELSKEYVEAYPDRVKEMVKEKHITEEEVGEAKDVWDFDYYKR